MLARILPSGVVVVEAGPADWTQPLAAAEARLVEGAVEARRREFAAGRACARRALAVLGVHEATILAGPRREPLWPPGIVGSITHTGGYCAAAVARTTAVAALGMDAERRGAVGPELARMVCTPAERRRWPAPAWATLLFSMKESLFKAIFPHCGVELAFTDLELAVRPRRTADAGAFAIAGCSGAARTIPLDLRGLGGRFGVGSAHVFTAAWLPGVTRAAAVRTRARLPATPTGCASHPARTD